MAYNYDINFTKGDTIRWTQFFKNSDGSTFNFSGSTVYMNVRNSYSSGNTVVSYVRYISGNEYPTQPKGYTGGLFAYSGGTMFICIGSTYTNNLKIEKTATYEIKVKSPLQNVDVTTILKGNIYPYQNVCIDYTGLTTPATPPAPAPSVYEVVSPFLDSGNVWGSWQNDLYLIALPQLVQNDIKAAWPMYEQPYAAALGSGTDGVVNSGLYNSVLQGQLANWTASNNQYNSWYGTYPYHMELDFENILTLPYINDWQNSGTTAMNELIQCINLTKQLSPNSTVYQYDTPYIPIYAGGSSVRLFGGSGYTYTALITQFQNKINYLKNAVDIFDISSYCPFYENKNDYPSPPGTTGYIADYEYWNQIRFNTMVNTLGTAANVQLTMSFVLYPGADNAIPVPTTADQAAALGRLVFSNSFINQYAFTPAKNAGVKRLMLWEGWPYRIYTTQLSPATADTYLQRKVMNDLFKDLNPADNGYGLTADSSWLNTDTITKMWNSVLTKTIQLSNLFKT